MHRCHVGTVLEAADTKVGADTQQSPAVLLGVPLSWPGHEASTWGCGQGECFGVWGANAVVVPPSMSKVSLRTFASLGNFLVCEMIYQVDLSKSHLTRFF